MRNVEEQNRRLAEAAGVTEGDGNESPGVDVNSALVPNLALNRPKRADRPGARGVNLRDVAEAAQVSVATVSMVLNNNPRISRATHARVQRVMEKLGYQPNRLAQSLSSRYTNVLAVLLPDVRHAFADAYFGELVSGIMDRANKLGFKIMLEQAKPEFLAARKHLELFDRRYVDGVLCLGTNDHNTFLSDFDPDSYPSLVVDNCPEIDGMPVGRPIDHVMCDYDSGVTQAMNYLIQLGHRNIGLIMAAPEIATTRRVRDIYKQKLAAVGVTPADTLMVDGQFTEEGGAEACRQLLANHKDLTAILAGNDKMAIGAMHLLNRLGIDVPKDISIVGFDDLKHAAFVNPALTTVHLPLYQVGALATDRIIERIHGRRESVSETISTHLVVRDSTAMVRTASRGAFEDSD
ncbi:MAG: LacI family DNA-binding transcriptional regulator [Tepidisphaeraceae bacterium]